MEICIFRKGAVEMNTWYSKSLTIAGAVVTIVTAILTFLNAISPEVTKLVETIGGALILVGLRKKMQNMGGGNEEK